MTPFEDLERFVKQHRACGSLMPSTSAPMMGGYLLTLTCSCGATFDRWVTPEEAKQGPLAAMARAADPRTPAAQPPPAAPAPPRSEPPQRAATPSLEAVMQEALEALEAPAKPGGEKPPAPPPSLDDAVKLALESVEAPPPKPAARPRPDKQALQEALKSTLEAVDAEDRKPAAAPPAPRRAATLETASKPSTATQTDEITMEVAPPPSRLTLGRAIAILAVLLVVVAGWYTIRARSRQQAEETGAASRASVRRITEADRAPVSETVTILKDLQTVSRVDVPYRVYFNRVSFAKADVDRQLAAVKDAELKTALSTTLGIHLLAADAWKAKTLNERDKWEAVGDDPVAELCPGTKRVLGIGDEPPGMTRSAWRGMAIAAAIPLLWDCTSDRVAEVERSLKER